MSDKRTYVKICHRFRLGFKREAGDQIADQDEAPSSEDENAEDANTPGDYPDNMSKDEAGGWGLGGGRGNETFTVAFRRNCFDIREV